MYHQCLELCPAYSRHLINICQMDKRMGWCSIDLGGRKTGFGFSHIMMELGQDAFPLWTSFYSLWFYKGPKALKLGFRPWPQDSMPDHTQATLGEQGFTPNLRWNLFYQPTGPENPWVSFAGGLGGWEHLQLPPALQPPQGRQNWSNRFSWATPIPAVSTEISKPWLLSFVPDILSFLKQGKQSFTGPWVSHFSAYMTDSSWGKLTLGLHLMRKGDG